MSSAYTEQDLRIAINAIFTFAKHILTDEERKFATVVLNNEHAKVRSEARAGMREACKQIAIEQKTCEEHSSEPNAIKACAEISYDIEHLPDLAADEAIERIREEAHEAALPLAAEQIIGALAEGGEFAESSPLAKVMQAIERIKAKAMFHEHVTTCKECFYLGESLQTPCARRLQLEQRIAALEGKETEHE